MADTRAVLFLGRNVGYPVALEGALKLKELAYIHAEGFAAGELQARPDRADRGRPAGLRHRAQPRHARTSCTRRSSPTSRRSGPGARAPSSSPTRATTTSSPTPARSSASRSARRCWRRCWPSCRCRSSRCELSTAKGLDVDQPRNLAKSVTVEMIVGVGIDVVDVARFGATLERTPALRERLFTDAERDLPLTRSRPGSRPRRRSPRRSARRRAALARRRGAPRRRRPPAPRGARHGAGPGRRAGRHHAAPVPVPRRRHRVGGRRRRRSAAVIEAWSTGCRVRRRARADGDARRRRADGAGRRGPRRGARQRGSGERRRAPWRRSSAPATTAATRCTPGPASPRPAGRRCGAPRHGPRGGARGRRGGRGRCSRPTRAALGEADLVLDGILGIGGRAGLRDGAAGWLAALAETAHVVAVDLPTGQDPMGGEVAPRRLRRRDGDLRVAKPVHLLPADRAGLRAADLVDIGLDLDDDPVVRRLDHDDVAALWPVPVAGRRQVPPRRARGRGRRRGATPARRCSA